MVTAEVECKSAGLGVFRLNDIGGSEGDLAVAVQAYPQAFTLLLWTLKPGALVLELKD